MNIPLVIYFYYPLFISSSFCIICFCHNDLNSKYEISDPKFTRLAVIETLLISTWDFIYYFLVAFFLPATVLRLPLRVRLLVRVR